MQERWSVFFVNPQDFDANNPYNKETFGRWKESFQTLENRQSWFFHLPFSLAPTYSLASQNYSASIISLNNVHFIAMEGPNEKNLDAFYQVLDGYSVTDLLRLTAATEKDRIKSYPYPYWEGQINIHPVSGRVAIEVQNRSIHYFPMDLWKNHQGLEPKKLLALINAVKDSKLAAPPKIIAVHCSAGAGRTGTFIAVYLLVDEINGQIDSGLPYENLDFSIDKIIWQISLQRPFMATHFPQYRALYELANHYISEQKQLRS